MFKVPFEVFLILFLGVFIARYAEFRGFSKRVEEKFRGLFVLLGVPPQLITVFFISLLAGFAGEAMLSLMVSENRIDRRDVIPGLMFINFPIFFSFVPLVLAITVPLVGVVGLYYVVAQLAISLVITLTGVLWFKLRRGRDTSHSASEFLYSKEGGAKEAAKDAFRVSVKVSLVVFFAIALVHFLFKMGAVNYFIKLVSRVHFGCFPPKIMPISLAHALHLAAGAVVAGKLLPELKGKLVLLGMLWGYVLGTPVRGAVNILPRYCALFGVPQGVKAWLVVQLYRSMVGAAFAVMICKLLVYR